MSKSENIQENPREQEKILHFGDALKDHKELFNILIFTIEQLQEWPGQSVLDLIYENKIIEQAATLPPIYDKPIASAIIKQFKFHVSETHSYIKTIKEHRALVAEKKKPKAKNEKALSHEYIELIESELGELKKDFFSHDLLFLDHQSGRWESVENLIEAMKGASSAVTDSGGKVFDYVKFHPIVSDYKRKKRPEMICQPPPWDGEDRISIMAKCLVLGADQSNFSFLVVEELIKDWFSKAWQRFHEPTIRNRILILQGSQHKGKDTWINALTGGLGQWSRNLTIDKNEKDNLLQLKDSAILKIAEFDRTSKTETSLLKHMVTAESIHVREPHGRRAKHFDCRCSFAASCNPKDIFRDSSGHTRYIVFELEDIIWKYPKTHEDSRQMLAQAKALAEADFKASKETEKVLADYLEGKTPKSFDEGLLEVFNENFETFWQESDSVYLKRDIAERGWMTNKELEESRIIEKTAKICGVSQRQIQLTLNRLGQNRSNYKHRGYAVIVPSSE